jgi:hypothetical protein
MGYVSLLGGILSRYLLPLLPWASPNVSLLGVGLLALTISHGWVAYKTYSWMSERQEQAVQARDAEWKAELKRADEAQDDEIRKAIKDAERLIDPGTLRDVERMCDQSAECRDKSKK